MSKRFYASNNIRGKQLVNTWLSRNPNTRSMIPLTKKLTLQNLVDMLDQYKTLYVKPDIGSLGIDVHKIRKTESGLYLTSVIGKKQKRKTFQTPRALYDHLHSKYGAKKMIVQKGIQLARIGRRPYDIRAMVQRKPRGKWTCTGFLVKVGKAGKIVTNYYQGGEIYTIEKTFRKLGYPPLKRKKKIDELRSLSVRIARILSHKRSGMHEMGIDFAIDRNQKIWILEVNSNQPQFYPLRKLDRTAYERMKQYARSYGRKGSGY